MGCSSSNPTLKESNQSDLAQQKNMDQNSKNSKPNYPPSEAYVISFNDESIPGAAVEDVLTMTTLDAAQQLENVRAPPERLQKVIEQTNLNATENNLNIEDINEKLEKAEIRRKEFLQNKVENSRRTQRLQDSTMHRLSEQNDENVEIEGKDENIDSLENVNFLNKKNLNM